MRPMRQERSSITVSTVVNESDHGAIVTITASLCLVCSLLLFSVRLSVRWPWRAMFGSDDMVAMAALLMSLIQAIVACIAVEHGLGRSEKQLDGVLRSLLAKMLCASNVFFVVSLCLGKLAVPLLFIRLSDRQALQRWSKTLGTICVLYGLVGVLTVATCSSLAPVAPTLLRRWGAVTAMGSIIDICIAVVPFLMVHGLQMDLGTKARVITAFALRLPVIVFSVLRLVSISRLTHSPDPTLAYASTETWTQVEMSFNVISASIPCLRVFVQSLRTGQLDGTMFLGPKASMDSRRATKGSGNSCDWGVAATRGLGNLRSWSLELATGDHGQTITEAKRNASIPPTHDRLEGGAGEKEIVVSSTVDVRYTEP